MLLVIFENVFAEAKAAEAAQSAYYDPNQPQMAYVPPPAYYVSSCYSWLLSVKSRFLL